MRLDRREVHAVFTRPIQKMIDPLYRSYELVKRPDMIERYGETAEGLMIPRFGGGIDQEKERGEVIWGLTAWIADSILTRVVVPKLKDELLRR